MTTDAALAITVGWVRKQIAKDAANRYSLLADWTLPACRCSFWPDAVDEAETALFRISRLERGTIQITVKAYTSTAERNICDGATMSPDTVRGVLPAAMFHDPWYYADESAAERRRQYEIIADSIGAKARELRRFGDRLFYSIGRAAGGSRLALSAYYYGIRIGYPLYRLLKPFLVAAVASSLGGCVGGGCGDGSFLDPGQYTPPAIGRAYDARDVFLVASSPHPNPTPMGRDSSQTDIAYNGTETRRTGTPPESIWR